MEISYKREFYNIVDLFLWNQATLAKGLGRIRGIIIKTL
jgi:hypothetical protein